jgi:transcription termination factor Rho
LDGPPRPRETIAPKIEIPPLPDDDFEGFVPIDQFSDVRGAEPEDSRPEPPDEFEPIEEERVEAARTAPPGRSAKEVLAGVWAGEFHASALDGFPDAEIERLAVEYRLVPEPGERRADLLYRLVHEGAARSPVETFAAEGLLEVMPEGYGFLRQAEHSYAAHEADPYVPGGLIRRVGLRMGHWVGGTARRPRPGERYAALVEVEEVNHEDPESLAGTVPFEELTVTHPDRRFVLETTPGEVAMRVLDLFCPLGRGQRALVVSPPRAGKTILLQKLADSIAHNAPEAEIVVLLVDERPEEVTNMRRSVRGEVIASTFDYAARRHIQVAELVMEKVKRMVEMGRHVVLLLDSLTRLGRAYNNESGGRGRLLTGGLEANALTKPKRFFGAARNVEGGGSLTIVATALVDTGSRLDQVIFEEFKGTGNMEVALSRELANRRIWPAIDIPKSGTRKEELLLHPDEQRRVTAMRREMSGMDPADAMLDVLERMEKHETNAELLMSVST